MKKTIKILKYFLAAFTFGLVTTLILVRFPNPFYNNELSYGYGFPLVIYSMSKLPTTLEPFRLPFYQTFINEHWIPITIDIIVNGTGVLILFILLKKLIKFIK